MPPRASLPALGRGTFLLITGHFPPLLAAPKPCEGGQISACQRVSVSLFLGPHRAVVPKPTDEANRCILGHLTPKALQKTLYVGYSQMGRPLPVVCFGWSQLPFPEAPLAGQAGPIYLEAAVEQRRHEDAKAENNATLAISPKSEAFAWQVNPKPPPSSPFASSFFASSRLCC